MTGDNLARIQRVSLREGWPNEAHDFTPWLARNIGELGAALGVDLELQEMAARPAGSLNPGLLASDRRDGQPVVIASQLQLADNDHLSRLLLYATGQDAKLVVWVASEIGTEHRQVLDWLNQRTGENTQFYGVSIELLRVDDSRPAPLFSVMAAPAGWIKPGVDIKAAPPLTAVDRHEWNRQFRRQLEERLRREHNYSVSPQNPDGGRSWCVFEGIDADFHLVANWGNNLDVQFNIWKGVGGKKVGGAENWAWNRRAFERLEQWREIIDADLLDAEQGEQLTWQIQRIGRIRVCRPGNIYDNPQLWDEYHDWIIAKFFRFKEVFTPLLAELTAAGDGG